MLPLTLFVLFALQRQMSDRAWGPWITFSLCTFVLLSPRTEVATFVVVAPVYVLLGATIMELQDRRTQVLALLVLSAAAYLVSLHSNPFTDRHFVVSELPQRSMRVLGTLLLFGMAHGWLSASVYQQWRSPASVQRAT